MRRACELMPCAGTGVAWVASRVVVLTAFPKTVREEIGPRYPIASKPFNTAELLNAIGLRLGGKR